MKNYLVGAVSVIALGVTVLSAQAPGADLIVKLDPALDAIVSADAKLDVLAMAFDKAVAEHRGFSEGPIWVPEGQAGYLLFTDVESNMIRKWTPDDKVTVFRERAGYSGDVANPRWNGKDKTALLKNPLLGPNCLTRDEQGRIVICAVGDRQIVRLEEDGRRTILADAYNGRPFNRTNDAVVKSNGSIYFTDSGNSNDPVDPFTPAAYLLKGGRLQQLVTNNAVDQIPGEGVGLDHPNGIVLSPDEKSLYISDSGTPKVLLRYDVNADDTISNGRVFFNLGPDGVKVDVNGNLYLARDGIQIVSPEGTHLGTINIARAGLPPGTAVSNLAFGDADYKTLYITARRH